MNHTIKEATVRTDHYYSHAQLQELSSTPATSPNASRPWPASLLISISVYAGKKSLNDLEPTAPSLLGTKQLGQRHERALAAGEADGVGEADFAGQRVGFCEVGGKFGDGVSVRVDQERDAGGVSEREEFARGVL